MSQCDFEDDWEDFTPSLQDQLFENLASVELAAASANHDMIHEPIIPEQQQQQQTTATATATTGEKAAFELFLEELECSQNDNTATIKNNLSQHSSSSSTDKAKNTKPNQVEKRILVKADSLDDDAIWGGDFDIDMLSVIQDKTEREAKNDDDIKIGFFTAGSKKPIEVSKEAQEKAKALFAPSSSQRVEEGEQQIPLLDEQLSSQIVENMGFVTASGKDIPQPSQRAFDRAKSLLILPVEEEDPPFSVMPKQEIEEEEQKVLEENSSNKKGNPTQLGGFVTANGKEIKPPSKEALERAKKILHDQSLAAVTPLEGGVDVDDVDKMKQDKKDTEGVGETSDKQETNGITQQQDGSNNNTGNKQESNNETSTTTLGTKRIADSPLDSAFKYDEKEEHAIHNDKENSNNAKKKTIIVNETKKRAVSSDPLDSTVPSSSTSLSSSLSSSTAIVNISEHHSHNNNNNTNNTNNNNTTTPNPSLPHHQQQQTSSSIPSIKRKVPKPLQKDFHLHPQQDKTIKDILKKTMPPSLRRPGGIRKTPQVKPFKSPIIPSKINLTKAAIAASPNTKATVGEPVFDLIHIPKDRYPLKALGKPKTGGAMLSGMEQSVLKMSLKSAKTYTCDDGWGVVQAKEDMIQAGCQPAKLSLKWVTNHYAMIVWKLASLIRSYPEKFKDVLNPKEITRQLLYRYEREVNRGHRSVIKKILEQDDVPTKHMVLVISEIVSIPTTQPNTSKFALRLTDGWYEILTTIDPRMSRAIEKQRLKVGHKLSICGAKLLETEPITPLDTDDTRPKLIIASNSALPAKWDTKLGYNQKKFVYRPIPTLFDDGGMVTMLDIIVCRKYQLMYMETLPNGNIIYRTSKEEEDYVNGNKTNNLMDIIPNFRPERTYDKPNHNNPIKEEERRVNRYFKIKVCDSQLQQQQQQQGGEKRHCFANILISNANEIAFMDIKEGSRYRISFLVPYGNKRSLLHLKTMNITRWEPLPIPQVATAYIPRSLLLTSSIKDPHGGYEIDMVAFVLQANTPKEDTSFGRHVWHQTILVTDQSLGLCQINLRYNQHPLKEEELNGQVVGLLNLKFERYDAKFDITCLSMTDESELVFKSLRVQSYVIKGLKELKSWVVSHKEEVRSVMERLDKIVQ